MKTELKAIIIDDEQSARHVLSTLLERNCPEVRVMDCCSNVIQAIESIKKYNPDVVFLDIQMPEYAGYEIVNFFEEVAFEIIFVTAFNEFALKAFDLSAIDYLLKPIVRQRLINAVGRVQLRAQDKKTALEYKTLVNNLDKEKDPQILISETAGKRVVKLNEILTVEGQRAYSQITLIDGQKILVSKNLKSMSELFSEYRFLFRCHKSWIVNIKKIHRINSQDYEIILDSSFVEKVRLSPAKVKEMNALM